MGNESGSSKAVMIAAVMLLCSITSACGPLRYASNSELAKMGLLPALKEQAQAPGQAAQGRTAESSHFLKPLRRNNTRHFGALVLKRSEDNAGAEAAFQDGMSAGNGGENQDMVFFIKRESSRIVAETELYSSASPDKSFFDKTYLSVGADRKNRSLGITFRFTY